MVGAGSSSAVSLDRFQKPADFVLYAFVDERYRYTSSERFLATACIAAHQSRFTPLVERRRANLPNVRDPSFLEAIDRVLYALDGFAVVGAARIDPKVLRLKDTDSTSDIREMARTDNAWSTAVVFTIGRTLAWLAQCSAGFSTVDVYFDPKNLKADHWLSVAKALRKSVPQVHQEFCDLFHFRDSRKASIRRVEQVPKQARGARATKFQVGVALADALCRHAGRPFRRYRRIEHFDFSELVTEHLLRWDVWGTKAPAKP